MSSNSYRRCPPIYFSRRKLMVGSTTTAMMASTDASADPAIQACHVCRGCQAEYEDLIKRWQTLETYLIRDDNWCRLSGRERSALLEAAELDAVDDRLDALYGRKMKLLANLTMTNATTSRGFAAKLAVIAAVVHSEENSEAYDLIASALRDVRTMAGMNRPEKL